jgi:hypothetical protein
MGVAWRAWIDAGKKKDKTPAVHMRANGLGRQNSVGILILGRTTGINETE